MEGIYTFPCLKQKRLDSGPGTPNVTSPAPCLHGSAQTQRWPAGAAGGVTTFPPGRGHHTRPSVLSWNLICLAEAEHRQKRLEFHPRSPAAQRRLCVKQKWIPLVRQSLTRTGNTYLKKIWKLTILSCKNSTVWTVWSPSQRVFTHTRKCHSGKYVLTGSHPQPSRTSPVLEPCSRTGWRAGIALRIHHSEVNCLSSHSKTFSELVPYCLKCRK